MERGKEETGTKSEQYCQYCLGRWMNSTSFKRWMPLDEYDANLISAPFSPLPRHLCVEYNLHKLHSSPTAQGHLPPIIYAFISSLS